MIIMSKKITKTLSLLTQITGVDTGYWMLDN